MAGKEFSDILVKNFEQPLRTDVAPPKGAKSLAELTLFEPKLEAIEKELPELKNKWRDTFGA
jgi:iron(III) transport system substrate-binding protein